MASVGNSGKSNASQTDTVGQIREEYRKKMYEQEVRHRRELRDIVAAHARDVDRLKEQAANKEDELKAKSQAAITKRDSQYRSQVEQMRKLHQEQLERTSEENNRKATNLRVASDDRLQKQQQVADQQIALLTESNEEAMRKRDERLQEYVKESQSAQSAAREDQRLKLTEKHKQELNALKGYHAERTGELERNLRELDSRRKSEVQGIERSMKQKMAVLENNMTTQLESEQSRHQKAETLMRDGFDESLNRAKDRYRKDYERRAGSADQARAEFEQRTNERIDKEVSILERDLAKAEKGKIDDDYFARQHLELEKSHLRSAFQAQIEDLQDQRAEALGQFNEKMQDETHGIIRQKDKLYNQTVRDHLEDKHKLSLREQERYDNKVTELENLHRHTNEEADARVNRLRQNTNQTLEQMADKYEDTVEGIKAYYVDKMQKQREQLLSERDLTLKEMRNQISEDRKKFEQKLLDAESHYKNERELILARHEQEVKRLENMHAVRVKESEKLTQMGQESERAKYEARIEQLRENHREELARLNRKHQEELTKFAVTNRYARS